MTRVQIVRDAFDSETEVAMFADIENISKWYIGLNDVLDHEMDRDFLTDFMCSQNSFPVYLIVETFGDITKELTALLEDQKLSYTFRQEGPTNKTFPVLKAVINDAHSFKLVIKETCWIAVANNFFSLSFSDNCQYKTAMRKTIWGREKPYVHPFYCMKEPSTVIHIWHDGDGFNLFSNEPRYKTFESLVQHLPEGTSAVIE